MQGLGGYRPSKLGTLRPGYVPFLPPPSLRLPSAYGHDGEQLTGQSRPKRLGPCAPSFPSSFAVRITAGTVYEVLGYR